MKVFKKSDTNSFIKQLQSSVKRVEENLIKGLQEAEYVINLDSQSMIPYDSGEAYESWFSRIENNPNELSLKVGYDEGGALPYLAIIHEVGPLDGGYGRKAWEDRGVDYTEEGFKITAINGQSVGKPEALHQPQTLFLKKALESNWKSIRDNNLKVNFK